MPASVIKEKKIDSEWFWDGNETHQAQELEASSLANSGAVLQGETATV